MKKRCEKLTEQKIKSLQDIINDITMKFEFEKLIDKEPESNWGKILWYKNTYGSPASGGRNERENL